MRFTCPIVFLVCAGHTLATTTKCAACAHEINTLPFQNKCYRANAQGSAGLPETVCTYEEKNGAPMGVACTYDRKGDIIRSDSVGACIDKVPVDSMDCPPCLA